MHAWPEQPTHGQLYTQPGTAALRRGSRNGKPARGQRATRGRGEVLRGGAPLLRLRSLLPWRPTTSQREGPHTCHTPGRPVANEVDPVWGERAQRTAAHCRDSAAAGGQRGGATVRAPPPVHHPRACTMQQRCRAPHCCRRRWAVSGAARAARQCHVPASRLPPFWLAKVHHPESL